MVVKNYSIWFNQFMKFFVYSFQLVFKTVCQYMFKQSVNMFLNSYYMNKENQFYQNQISTGIHDSCSKTSKYSSRFLQAQKKSIQPKKILPSKYQKAAIYIQRYWRFYQYMKRRVNQKIIQETSQQNQCYELQNRILDELLSQYENVLQFKQALFQNRVKQMCADFDDQISKVKKQCVMTSFKLEKKNPTKQLLSELVHKKQEQSQINLLLNRQKFIIDQDLEEQIKQNQSLLKYLKRLNISHLQLVKQKNELSHRTAQKMLQTSKFGSKILRGNKGNENQRILEQIFHHIDSTE